MPQDILLQFDEALPPCPRHLPILKFTQPFPDLTTFHEAVIETARVSWENRARSEYIGVLLLRQFHGILIDLNAPADMQELVLLMQLQEQRHTRHCIAMAKRLGSDATISCDLEELRIARQPQAAVQFYEMLCSTYLVGEVLALKLLQATIACLPSSAFKDCLKNILKDEALHSQFGRMALEYLRGSQNNWLPYPGDDWIKSQIKDNLIGLGERDVIEADEAKMFTNWDFAAQLPYLGVPDSRHFKKIYDEALAHDIPAHLKRMSLS